MRSTIREKDVDRAFQAEVAKHDDLISIKLSTVGASGTSGWPDRLLLGDGARVAFTELKRPGGKLTSLQARQLGRLKLLGFDVEVVDTPATARGRVGMFVVGSATHELREARWLELLYACRELGFRDDERELVPWLLTRLNKARRR